MQKIWTVAAAGVAAVGVVAAVQAARLLLIRPDMAVAAGPAAPKEPKSALDFTVRDIDGKEVALAKYKGDVVLIVNTASLCGNTPQYASLETLYQKYKSKGLRILAFPANNFGGQEPGKNNEIKEFCTSKYKTTFDLFDKVSVAPGANQAPLYAYLTDKNTNGSFSGPIEWNFAKFLVGRNGKVIARFPAGKDPLTPDVVAPIEQALAEKAPAMPRK